MSGAGRERAVSSPASRRQRCRLEGDVHDHDRREPQADHPRACACHICGRPIDGLPHDLAYGLPDCIFAMPPEERAARSWSNGDAAMWWTADESHGELFVRGLLPVPIGPDDEFRYGVWLQVDGPTWERIIACWDDEPAYAALRFRARIANALQPWGERTLGLWVEAGTRTHGQRPFVVGADDPWLATLLRQGWSEQEFRAFAQSLL
jgi:hypothetical protein